MIKFGISRNYIPNWGAVQATREIFQNFIDYGEYNIYHGDSKKEGIKKVSLTNDFQPESWEFLKIGMTSKTAEDIGGHGEGLKLAGLIFLRENKHFSVDCCLGMCEAKFYEDESLGECYGLEVESYKGKGFSVTFEVEEKYLDIFLESTIKKEDILYECYYGRIVNKPKGNIYIGGLFVCNVKYLKYSFDFPPSSISLSRDRDVPSDYDLKYHANEVVAICFNNKGLKVRASQVNDKEFEYGLIPNKIAEKFNPEVGENGKIQMVSGKTVVTDPETIRKIAYAPKVAAKMAKLKYKTVKVKTPKTVLTEFKSSLAGHPTKILLELEEIIKMSSNWKNK